MSGRQSAATDRAMALVQAGATMRAAAIQAGVALSTLVRACQRAGLVLQRGRRPRPAE